MAAVLDAGVEASLASAGTLADLKDSLIKNTMTTVAQIALLASDESRWEDKIFPIMKTGGVKLDRLLDQVAV